MSPEQEILNLAGAELAGAESESKTLFDVLAGLVPVERQAEYDGQGLTSPIRQMFFPEYGPGSDTKLIKIDHRASHRVGFRDRSRFARLGLHNCSE